VTYKVAKVTYTVAKKVACEATYLEEGARVD
jgi:hypothetical protein